MCGIVGCIDSNHDRLRLGIDRMVTSLAHRGPDDSGSRCWHDHGVALGQTRLAIIDLSPAGHNPMPNEDQTVWITFNGEIYNFQALRAELEDAGHHFRSNTDTEIIIHAYEEWGDAHVQRLRGMFAYALYDRRVAGGRLLLVRDRFGIKPLHYRWDGHTLQFASEIKAICAYPGVQPQVDRSALFDYLTYYYIPAPKTAYSDIKKLPPATILTLANGRMSLDTYWQLEIGGSTDITTIADAAAMVNETLDEAVRLHLLSDVPLGIFLSGGIDSSAVTAAVSSVSDDRPHTFSIGFDVAAHSETDDARVVARHFNTHHTEKQVTLGDLPSMLDKVVSMYDEPFADGSAVPTFAVAGATRANATVALSGDGGDELFWGYRWFQRWLNRRSPALPKAVRALTMPLATSPRWQARVQFATASPFERYGGIKSLLSPVEKRRLLTRSWQQEFDHYDDFWHYRDHWRPDLDPISQVQYLETKTYLPGDILTKVDRASMAVALEVRPPLLDHVLAERVMGLPTSLRVPDAQLKGLLKQAMSSRLPQQTLSKPKKGFSAPYRDWLRQQQDWTQRFLTDGALVQWGLLRVGGLNELGLADEGNRLWGLLVLEQWLRRQS